MNNHIDVVEVNKYEVEVVVGPHILVVVGLNDVAVGLGNEVVQMHNYNHLVPVLYHSDLDFHE
jgi:hypothetical protein